MAKYHTPIFITVDVGNEKEFEDPVEPKLANVRRQVVKVLSEMKRELVQEHFKTRKLDVEISWSAEDPAVPGPGLPPGQP